MNEEIQIFSRGDAEFAERGTRKSFHPIPVFSAFSAPPREPAPHAMNATETRRLESLYQQKQAALAALKKSLLHQAFTGEL